MEGRWFGGRNPRITDPPQTMPLTDIKIRQAKATDKALKLADAAGLYLEVKPNGSKLWRYRYRIAGRENLYAIGDYPSVSLADARKARDDARDLMRAIPGARAARTVGDHHRRPGHQAHRPQPPDAGSPRPPHLVLGVLHGGQLVGLRNLTTGEQVNFVRSDPPLLWRRCDGVGLALLVAASVMAWGAGWALAGAPLPRCWPCSMRPRQ